MIKFIVKTCDRDAINTKHCVKYVKEIQNDGWINSRICKEDEKQRNVGKERKKNNENGTVEPVESRI